ncbi:hypothetical protein L596_012002 [Steinernema carpocapsae]|uniref:Piwi domain-containing protein n=1 Tax=Steinernema carpocapsae TaxID=34508 RepID=A0A4U5NW34_STECR|nr:hypothetical protein L596_012002 [Steinernema carpocapsae]
MDVLTEAMSKMLPMNIAPKIVGAQDPYERVVPLTANMFPLHMRAEVPIFMYNVQVFMKVGFREVNLVKRNTDDFTIIDHKNKCRSAFRFAVRAAPQVFGHPSGLFYDIQAQLYSVRELKDVLGNDLKKKEEIIVPGEDARKAYDFQDIDLEYLRLVIEPVNGTNPSINLGELVLKQKNFSDEVPCELLQFLDVACSQHAFLTPTKFTTYPGGFAYFNPTSEEPARELPDAARLHNGVHKSVKVIEGSCTAGRCGELAVVLDPKKAAFHKPDITVVQKIQEMGFLQMASENVAPHRIPELAEALKNVFVETRHGKRRSRFAIHSVVAESARTNRFTKDDGQVTVEEHFKKEYDIALKYPHLPLVVSMPLRKKTPSNGRAPPRLLFFPMEVLFICPNQRVLRNQQSAKQNNEVIKSCAVAPEHRLKDVIASGQKMRINGPNVHGCLNSAQIQVESEPLKVEGRTLVPPNIDYKGCQVQVDSFTGKWRNFGRNKPHYLEGGKIGRWGLYVLSKAPSSEEEQLALKFKDKMLVEFQSRGMQIDLPMFLATVKATPLYLRTIFEKARKERLEFLFFIQDKDLALHNEMKFYERAYEVITQDLRTDTARAVIEQGKNLSLENIIAKLNVKVGGTNYSVNGPSVPDLFKKGRLYIGLQASTNGPPAAGAHLPTVVGSAANVTTAPSSFVGDIYFQKFGEMDLQGAMASTTEGYVKRYAAVHGRAPDEVFIYRSGTANTNIGQMLRDEVPAIRCALKNSGASRARLTLVMVTKQHNVRLMPTNMTLGGRAIDQNIKPGTVVDQKITHPRFAEFYLNSHQALHGSAKTPKYVVVADDCSNPIQYLERVTYALSYGHQIVGMPTSLPSPVYIAGKYAERGAALLQTKRNLGGALDVDALAEELAYANSKVLGFKRINA